jgi:hypothetical protein
MTAHEKGLSGIGGATNSAPQSLGYNAETNEVLVWKKDTWGNFGQHSNKYTFVILPDLKIKPIWEVLTQLRHENNDSRKNAHRYTYAQLSDILKLKNHILKVIYDYASSSKRDVSVRYFFITNSKVIELESKSGFKDSSGFYDEVELPNGQKLKVYKDKVELIQ